MIKLENTHKYYVEKANRLHVLKGIYLDNHEGKMAATMGSSGSGKSIRLTLAFMMLFMACSVVAGVPDPGQLRQQVEDTERAFARTMAERDHDAFTSFLSDEAIFFSGESPLRGKQQVADAWKPYFQDQEAPFSWEPQTVEVLDSGTLALSSGPVRDAEGNVVATFNSVWRLGPGGDWKIIFDKGNRACADP